MPLCVGFPHTYAPEANTALLSKYDCIVNSALCRVLCHTYRYLGVTGEVSLPLARRGWEVCQIVPGPFLRDSSYSLAGVYSLEGDT